MRKGDLSLRIIRSPLLWRVDVRYGKVSLRSSDFYSSIVAEDVNLLAKCKYPRTAGVDFQCNSQA
jgi:hypothetical protein